MQDVTRTEQIFHEANHNKTSTRKLVRRAKFAIKPAVTAEALMQLRIRGHLPMQHLWNCKMVQKVSINTVLAAVEQRDASETQPAANGNPLLQRE